MVAALFFDLDGTLLDTAEDIRFCLNQTLREFSLPEIGSSETKAFIGNGAEMLVRRALPRGKEALLHPVLEAYKKRYAESDCARVVPFAGGKEFLLAQAERGRKLAIVTNKPQPAVEACVGRFFPEVPFSFAAGESGLFPCKPDPSLTRYAALTMRVSPAESVFIGDGETDVMTAKNAGMRCVSVLWGYRSKERLQEAGARVFASDFAELSKILGGE